MNNGRLSKIIQTSECLESSSAMFAVLNFRKGKSTTVLCPATAAGASSGGLLSRQGFKNSKSKDSVQRNNQDVKKSPVYLADLRNVSGCFYIDFPVYLILQPRNAVAAGQELRRRGGGQDC